MFPRITLRGSAIERGRQYGQAAADRITISVDGYRDVFAHYAGWDWDRVCLEAERYLDPIEAVSPRYLDELRGIAEGCERPLLEIVAINVRTEIMFAAKARNAAAKLPSRLECTSFAAVPAGDGPVLVGQNWDWKTFAFRSTVIIEAQCDDGANYVTAVEAGLLAKTGFNQHGLGIATNALVSNTDKGAPGAPYHVILRALLDCATPTDALALLQKHDRSSSAHYLIAHRDHLALSVESTPGGFDQLYLTDPDEHGIVLHTNHFTHPAFGGRDVGLWVMTDTIFRLQQARRLLRGANKYQADTYMRLLADHAGHPNGLCCHHDPSDIPAEQDASIFGLVMDLDSLTMRITGGQPCETAWHTIEYADVLAD